MVELKKCDELLNDNPSNISIHLVHSSGTSISMPISSELIFLCIRSCVQSELAKLSKELG